VTVPSITFWTRLEPYSRLDDVDRGLQAPTHDPLWLLARQWQTGEFLGEDAGTPVQARLRLERTPLARFRPGADGAAAEAYRADVPLEALVEREPVQRTADPRRDLRLAADAGLYFLRLLERAGVSAAGLRVYRGALGLALPAPPADGDRAAARYLSLMAGRVPDGMRVYRALLPTVRPKGGAKPKLPDKPALPAADRAKALRAATAFLDWFDARFGAPAAANAPSATRTWVSERLEYSFAVSARTADGELALTAPEYPGGSLEWHSFDLDPALKLGVRPADPQPQPMVRTVVPAPVRYSGMAADRWWEFEDGRVNLSRVEGDPDELLRLLLVEFALAYSNDWFVIPVDVQPGALLRARSLVVTDAFGERTLVPHYTASARPHPEWRLFALSPAAASSLAAPPPQDLLFLPPVLATSLHGDPVEEVVFLRDELTNLVWAVERLAPSVAGGALNRGELYANVRPDPVPLPPAEPTGEASYLLATTVPDYWIPFQPQRIDPTKPDVRLRRAAALLDEGGEIGFSRPLGRLLEPERHDLSLFEEEVPRSGLKVVRQFEYTRWVDGSTVLWLARRKSAGAGEGSSGLRFDRIEDA
jgi:hypothetical protein